MLREFLKKEDEMDSINRENEQLLKVPKEVRVAVTVKELAKVLRVFQEVFGLQILEEWHRPDGAGVVLKLENATLELLDEAQAEFVDKIETGASNQEKGVRLALQVADVMERGEKLSELGFSPANSPVTTPWDHFNWRFKVDDRFQLTLYQIAK
jgi:lactoylglutathione lyase